MTNSLQAKMQHATGVNIFAKRSSSFARAAFVALSLASCSAPTGAEESPAPGESNEAAVHRIEIRGFKFVPDKLSVRKGDKIVWKNVDAVPHTATAGDKQWDSGLIAGQAEWSMTAGQIGEFDYLCTFHPVMKATLTVLE